MLQYHLHNNTYIPVYSGEETVPLYFLCTISTGSYKHDSIIKQNQKQANVTLDKSFPKIVSEIPPLIEIIFFFFFFY